MHTVVTWFLSDPRRLCVVGVWVNLAAFAVSLFALLQADLGVAAGALLLFIGAALAKASGLQRFKHHRAARHPAATSVVDATARTA